MIPKIMSKLAKFLMFMYLSCLQPALLTGAKWQTLKSPNSFMIFSLQILYWPHKQAHTHPAKVTG